MHSQGFLFAEPSISDVCVWTQLRDDIDPADWAYLCRYFGKLEPKQFYSLLAQVKGQRRIKPNLNDVDAVPLVSIGCSGIGGEYQREIK
jgi:hypothetical protein